MARSLVQALEGLSFPCDRAHVLEFAEEHDISPRAMDFLRRLREQQYASMEELFAVLPSKGSLRKARQELEPHFAPELLPPQAAVAAAPEKEDDAREGEQDEDPEQDLPATAGRRKAPPIEPEAAGGPRRERQEPSIVSLGGLDPFGLSSQWQQAWLKGVESYTRLFMPWLRR